MILIGLPADRCPFFAWPRDHRQHLKMKKQAGYFSLPPVAFFRRKSIRKPELLLIEILGTYAEQFIVEKIVPEVEIDVGYRMLDAGYRPNKRNKQLATGNRQ